ncbi:mitotic spindle assembly checkpoint protein MAD2B-like isoform X2 [Mercenaria mercenaria]|uniref:mitotic spindle assembly checkpoint protein MAD2B-like isoform X2 n=1 Tax=Mercenaria mercenaria TaxID=6596 RepID=UPI001E1D82BB|nr:mitotic spindle assembly checkpoint protein MAD2B-like isoform X2 [Mercenaria mercenaria]
MADTDENKTEVGPDIFAEFLEVSIHLILYSRHLYPTGLFERRKKYNVPVQMCLHPDVTEYISKVIQSVKVMVVSGEVSMVTLVVLDQSQNPIERFVFELGASASEDGEDPYLFRLEDALRGFLLKLNVADTQLKPLPQECSWVVHVHTKESTADQFIQQKTFQDLSWVPADRKQTQLKDPVLIPLKTTNNKRLKMQLYVEESSDKQMESH